MWTGTALILKCICSGFDTLDGIEIGGRMVIGRMGLKGWIDKDSLG